MYARSPKSTVVIKRVNYESIFTETVPHHSFIWQIVEKSKIPEPQLTILQGKLLNKNEDEEIWTPHLFELQSDRLFRLPLNNESKEYNECIHLPACFVSKYLLTDSRMLGTRYAIRLQLAHLITFFLPDCQDSFKKWYVLLRRLCVLEKFHRKYKIIQKIKYVDAVFGQCFYNCIRLSDAGYYMVKVLEKDSLNSQQKHIMFKELHNLRRVHHSQLSYFVEVYEDQTSIYQVFEHYLGIDLRTFLRESLIFRSLLEEKLLADFMYGLLQALSHMHQKGVFHKDLRLENIFIPDQKKIPFSVIGNFSSSDSFRLNPEDQVPQKRCGLPGFIAPEVFKNKFYDQKVDVFALGVVFYIIVYGRMPFVGNNHEDILKQNERCEIEFRQDESINKRISLSGLDLLKQMLQKDPIIRPTSNQCVNHHWFIKIKSKNIKKPTQTGNRSRNKSLSTIVEKSEITDQTVNSFGYQPLTRISQIGKVSQQNRFSERIIQPDTFDITEKVAKEFDYDDYTVSEKLTILNRFTFSVPIKIREKQNIETQKDKKEKRQTV